MQSPPSLSAEDRVAPQRAGPHGAAWPSPANVHSAAGDHGMPQSHDLSNHGRMPAGQGPGRAKIASPAAATTRPGPNPTVVLLCIFWPIAHPLHARFLNRPITIDARARRGMQRALIARTAFSSETSEVQSSGIVYAEALDLRRARFCRQTRQECRRGGRGPERAGRRHYACPGRHARYRCTRPRRSPAALRERWSLRCPASGMTSDRRCIPWRRGRHSFARCRSPAHGLEWIHSPAALAHPLDDGTAVLLVRDLDEQCRMLGEDGAWRRILEPLSRGLVGAGRGHSAAAFAPAAASAAAGADGRLRSVAGDGAGRGWLPGCARAFADGWTGGALVPAARRSPSVRRSAS